MQGKHQAHFEKEYGARWRPERRRSAETGPYVHWSIQLEAERTEREEKRRKEDEELGQREQEIAAFENNVSRVIAYQESVWGFFSVYDDATRNRLKGTLEPSQR